VGIYEIKQPKKINSVSVSVYLSLAAVLYVGAWWIPVWWPVFTLHGVMRGICNDAYNDWDDDRLMKKLLREARLRSELSGLNEDQFKMWRDKYTDQELSSLRVTSNAAITNFQKRGKTCHITWEKDIKTEFPLVDKTKTIHFRREVETDLSTVKY
jgi:hypothetical protein